MNKQFDIVVSHRSDHCNASQKNTRDGSIFISFVVTWHDKLVRRDCYLVLCRILFRVICGYIECVQIDHASMPLTVNIICPYEWLYYSPNITTTNCTLYDYIETLSRKNKAVLDFIL